MRHPERREHPRWSPGPAADVPDFLAADVLVPASPAEDAPDALYSDRGEPAGPDSTG